MRGEPKQDWLINVNTTAIVAIVGVLGTLIGAFGAPLLQQRQAARIAEITRLRHLRTELYVDAQRFAMLQWELINASVASREYPDEAAESRHANDLSARMDLLAPEHVRDAWNRFIAVRLEFLYGGSDDAESGDDLVQQIDVLALALRAEVGGERDAATLIRQRVVRSRARTETDGS